MDKFFGQLSWRDIILLVSPSIFIILVQYVWKVFYIRGNILGIYWLFVFVDYWSYLSLRNLPIIAGLVFVIWGLLRFTLNENYVLLVGASIILLTISIAYFCSIPILWARNTVHLAQIEVNNKIYYLSAYPWFDINYAVCECDRIGLFCRNIYISGDITNGEWYKSQLNYHPETNQISLEDYGEHGEGIIFTHSVP